MNSLKLWTIQRVMKLRKKDDVICLATSNGIIKTKNHVFADYLDTHSCELARKIDNLTENHLNHTENENIINT